MSAKKTMSKKQITIDTGGFLIVSFRFTPLSPEQAEAKLRGIVSVVPNKSEAKLAERMRKQRNDETLNVEIISANQLTQTGLLTDQDTYVVATLLPQKTIVKRTNACEGGGQNPAWTSEHRNLLMLRVDDCNTALQLTVFAAATLGEDVAIGSVEVSLDDIPYLQNEPHSKQLVGNQEQEDEAGAMDAMAAWATEMVASDDCGKIQFKLYRY